MIRHALSAKAELRHSLPVFRAGSRAAMVALALAVVVAGAGCSSADPLRPNEPVRGAVLRIHSLNGAPPGAHNSIAFAGAIGAGLLGPMSLPAGPNFLFDITVIFEEDGSVLMYPVGLIGSVLGGGRDVGFRHYTIPFEELRTAPTSGYVFSEPVELTVGDVYAAAAIQAPICASAFVLVPNIYAKLLVEDIDPVTRTVQFRVITDPSCGFRRLTTDQN